MLSFLLWVSGHISVIPLLFFLQHVSKTFQQSTTAQRNPPYPHHKTTTPWDYSKQFRERQTCCFLVTLGSLLSVLLGVLCSRGFHRNAGDDHLFEPAEFHDPREELEAGRGTKPIRLVDGGFDFNHPLPPLLQPERALDVIIAFDYAEYRTGQRPGDVQGEWWRCIRNCRRNGLHLAPLEMDRLLEEPVSVFPGDESKGQPTLVVLHLFKVPGDPEDGFDPMGNAQAGGFCGVLSAKYTPEEYDTLVKFNRERLLSAVDKIKEVMLGHAKCPWHPPADPLFPNVMLHLPFNVSPPFCAPYVSPLVSVFFCLCLSLC